MYKTLSTLEQAEFWESKCIKAVEKGILPTEHDWIMYQHFKAQALKELEKCISEDVNKCLDLL